MDTIATVIERLQTAQERLLRVVERIEAARWNELSPNPGWTYKDVLAHLATGDWVCQMRIRGVLATGSVPPGPDIDAGNAELVEARRSKSVADLLQERRPHRQETLALLAELTEANLRVPMELTWLNMTTPFAQYLLGFASHDLSHVFELEAIAEPPSGPSQ